MKKSYLYIYLVLVMLVSLAFFGPESASRETILPSPKIQASPTVAITPTAPVSARIDSIKTVFQTFNNCGPASLSMILQWNGLTKSQDELGKILRPYQNPQGDNDDKSVSTEEIVELAQTYGLIAFNRPNGSVDLLQQFASHGIPIIVKTWLHPNEDIGHFRIVTGYDNTTQTIYQTDSYKGPDVTFDYSTFMEMWQPFNYQYIVIVTPDKEAVIKQIIGEDYDETTAWRNALARAEEELKTSPDAIYPQFNIAVAEYNLGHYQQSAAAYEKVADRLPGRMLWYQLEPIRAYQKIGEKDKVFGLTDRILNRNNRAYSELYLIRGQLLLEEGDKIGAREQFERAIYYNTNYKAAHEALEKVL